MRLMLCVLVLVLAFAPANATQQSSVEAEAVRLSEAAIGRQLPDLRFTTADNQPLALAELRGKPLLVTLVYTGCTDACPAIIENLRPAIEIAQSALGQDAFKVLTVGFDARNDTPERMRSFARSRGVDLPNWLFLAGSQGTVQRLADAVGFTIVPSAGGFDHMAQVSVVDAEGRIYQQIMGGVFNPPSVVEPLKDLMFNQRRPLLSVAGITERIKLFCTVYNPNTGRYYFNYSLFIGGGIGLVCLLLVGVWLAREFRLSGRADGGAQT